jgi:hypothetical protein
VDFTVDSIITTYRQEINGLREKMLVGGLLSCCCTVRWVKRAQPAQRLCGEAGSERPFAVGFGQHARHLAKPLFRAGAAPLRGIGASTCAGGGFSQMAPPYLAKPPFGQIAGHGGLPAKPGRSAFGRLGQTRGRPIRPPLVSNSCPQVTPTCSPVTTPPKSVNDDASSTTTSTVCPVSRSLPSKTTM